MLDGPLAELANVGQQSIQQRLRIQMQDLHNALAECAGDFERFLALVTKS